MIKNNRIAIYFLFVILFVKSFSDYLIFKNYEFSIVNTITSLILLIITILFYNLSKKIRNRNRYSGVINKNAIIYILLYYIVIYTLGLLYGFTRNPLSNSIITIITNFADLIIIKIIIEALRFNMMKTNESKLFCIISTIVFIYCYVNMNTIMSFNSNSEAFQYICGYLIPIITSGIISTYITKNGSLKTLLIIQIIPELIAVYAPIQPDLNFFLKALCSITAGTAFYLITKYEIELKDARSSRAVVKKTNPVSSIPSLALFSLLVLFLLGVFKYVPVAVMSNSMIPHYQRGDALIYEKVGDKSTLKVGDIICYRLDKIMVMHRIVSIEERNGESIFTTKGDNINHNDVKKVQENQIVGIIRVIIPKVGYPSVWFYEFLNG